MPGPWVSRARRIQWIQHKIQADQSLSGATRDELLGVIEHLKTMAPGDTKALAGWEKIKKSAPKMWEAVKPVIQTIVGEAVKKGLGL